MQVNFFALRIRTFTRCASLPCGILLFTARGSVPIWRFTNSRGGFVQANPSIRFGDGSTRRDYTYIDDIIQGTMAALDYSGPLYDVFNLGESQTVQLKDLISAIESALRKKAKINELPEQPGDMPLTYADISKARKLLGYNPTTKLSEGLPKFVEWFLRSK